MKKFNWTECEKQSNPETYALLKELHDKPTTEDEYTDKMLALPHNRLKTSRKRYSKRYQYLKLTFGFFQ